jgi:hypothetical protein
MTRTAAFVAAFVAALPHLTRGGPCSNDAGQPSVDPATATQAFHQYCTTVVGPRLQSSPFALFPPFLANSSQQWRISGQLSRAYHMRAAVVLYFPICKRPGRTNGGATSEECACRQPYPYPYLSHSFSLFQQKGELLVLRCPGPTVQVGRINL